MENVLIITDENTGEVIVSKLYDFETAMKMMEEAEGEN